MPQFCYWELITHRCFFRVLQMKAWHQASQEVGARMRDGGQGPAVAVWSSTLVPQRGWENRVQNLTSQVTVTIPVWSPDFPAQRVSSRYSWVWVTPWRDKGETVWSQGHHLHSPGLHLFPFENKTISAQWPSSGLLEESSKRKGQK